MGLCEWLWLFLQHEADDRRKVKAGNPGVSTAVSYLAVVVENWSTVEPNPALRQCVELVTDLLVRVDSKRQQKIREVHDEILAAYLLSEA